MSIKVSDTVKCMFVFWRVTPFTCVGVQKISCRCISLVFSSFFLLCKQIVQSNSFGRSRTPKVNSQVFRQASVLHFQTSDHELYSHKQSTTCQNNIRVLFCLKCLTLYCSIKAICAVHGDLCVILHSSQRKSVWSIGSS